MSVVLVVLVLWWVVFPLLAVIFACLWSVCEDRRLRGYSVPNAARSTATGPGHRPPGRLPRRAPNR
jgi:ACR3 family arsenite efflux pump ArsB